MSDMKRRNFLGLTGLAFSPFATAAVQQEVRSLTKTPRDAEGPFYPRGDRSNDTSDLLRDMTTPRGETLNLQGQIVNTQAQPQANLIMDIWQTDPEGRYKHPYDSSVGDRHTDFAYWGKAVTDSQGQFTFRTYVPGDYGGRPAHIHYIVWQGRKRLLTSQIYFKGFAERSGPVVKSGRPDLRKAELLRADATDFAIDFRIVV